MQKFEMSNMLKKYTGSTLTISVQLCIILYVSIHPDECCSCQVFCFYVVRVFIM